MSAHFYFILIYVNDLCKFYEYLLSSLLFHNIAQNRLTIVFVFSWTVISTSKLSHIFSFQGF